MFGKESKEEVDQNIKFSKKPLPALDESLLVTKVEDYAMEILDLGMPKRGKWVKLFVWSGTLGRKTMGPVLHDFHAKAPCALELHALEPRALELHALEPHTLEPPLAPPPSQLTP